jgi:alpha-beta hydrolase superfamily lysophospholipase
MWLYTNKQSSRHFRWGSSRVIKRVIAIVGYCKGNKECTIHVDIHYRWGTAWLECVKKLEERMESIEFPFLALHGDADELCDCKGSQIFYDKAKSKDKEIKVRSVSAQDKHPH